VLAHQGIIPHDELMTLRCLGSRLQGHPHRLMLPEVEVSSGSLGQGMSIAQGMALTAKLDGSDSRFYCMVGDGEWEVGQTWEAMMSAPKFGLDNLVVILDYNKGQIDGHVKDVMNIEPVRDKAVAFNWEVDEIDGHDLDAIDQALTRARALNGRPHFIIAHTIKGKGVSFMEDNIEWHGKSPTEAENEKAIAEVRARLDSIDVQH
jgi:transketolase